MNKPGRNDPCYCGSGKKYKQCHWKADQEAEQERRARVDAARFLREELQTFAQDARFAADVERALPFYWDNLYEASNAHLMSEYEALRFFDWLIFDYAPEAGPRLLERYAAERRDALTTPQQAMLDAWLETGVAGAYELVDYEGQVLQLRDFMTGEQFEAFEPGGRGAVEIGEVLLTRLVPVDEQLEFSTSAAYLPADEIADLRARLEDAQVADAETHPNATQAEFMRRNSHLLIHHALEQARQKGRPPVARLDPQRADEGYRSPDERHHEQERIRGPRNYGSTRPHDSFTRRKAV